MDFCSTFAGNAIPLTIQSKSGLQTESKPNFGLDDGQASVLKIEFL